MPANSEAFLELMRDQFQKDRDKITWDRRFRELEEWTSLQSLIIITCIDEAFDHTIDEQSLAQAATFKDLYNLLGK